MLDTSDFKSSFAFKQGSMKFSSGVLFPDSFEAWFRVESLLYESLQCIDAEFALEKRHGEKFCISSFTEISFVLI